MFLAEVGHAVSGGFWDEVWGIALDPAHIMAELIWTLVFDVIIIALMYNILFKQIILPRLRRNLREEIHHDIDLEHGITPEQHEHFHKSEEV